MKTQHTVALTGSFRNLGNETVAAKTHQADLVDFFVGNKEINDKYFTVDLIEDSTSYVLLNTPKGEYRLDWNPAGYYGALVNGVKIHVMLKKITGKLIYWS